MWMHYLKINLNTKGEQNNQNHFTKMFKNALHKAANKGTEMYWMSVLDITTKDTSKCILETKQKWNVFRLPFLLQRLFDKCLLHDTLFPWFYRIVLLALSNNIPWRSLKIILEYSLKLAKICFFPFYTIFSTCLSKGFSWSQINLSQHNLFWMFHIHFFCDPVRIH